MNVLQLMQDTYLPTITGNALVLDRFDKCINREHNDFIMIWNKERPEEEVIDGTKVFNPSGDRKCIKKKADDIINNYDIDIVISHSYDRDGKISIVDKLNIPKIMVAHYYYGEDMKEIHKHFDKVLCFQQKHIDDYMKLGIPEEKLFFLPPPINQDIFKPRNMNEKNSMLYVGRFIESKGMHKILPYLDYIDMEFRWAGPDDEDDYRNEFLNIAKGHGVKDRITLLGKLDKEELAKEYNRNKAFILLSHSDCYSLVLQESIASGTTPVVLENFGHYDWTRGHAFIESSVEMCAHRLKMMRRNKCKIEYDHEFVDTLCMERNAPRLNGLITEIGNSKSFKWEEPQW